MFFQKTKIIQSRTIKKNDYEKIKNKNNNHGNLIKKKREEI